MMVFVAITAINFGAIRGCTDFKSAHEDDFHYTFMIDALGTGILPMANILAVALLIRLRRRGSRPFLSGFAVFGATALALYVAVASFFAEELVMRYLHLVLAPLWNTLGGPSAFGTVVILIMYSTAAVMLLLPQVTIALIGGFLFRLFRIAEQTDCEPEKV